MCRVLGVSASGYYARLRRPPSARARADVRTCASRSRPSTERSRGTYGAPRIHARPAAAGIRVGRKRVARLMKQAGLRGVSRRKWIPTTVRIAKRGRRRTWSSASLPPSAPNHLWVADITLHSDLGRLALPGGRPRRLQPARSWAGRWRPSAHRAGARGAQHGARTNGGPTE